VLAGPACSAQQQQLSFPTLNTRCDTTPNHPNIQHRYDAVPSQIAKPKGSRNAALLEALDRLQGEGSLLALGRAGPDTTGLTVLRATLATEAELVRAGWRVRAGPRDVGLAARTLGRLSQPESVATETVVLSALSAYCRSALQGYPTALEEDEAEMAQIIAEQQQGGGGAGEQQQQQQQHYSRLQVLRALVSEKRALTGTAAAVAEWQARLASGCPPSELYAGLGDSDEDSD